MSFPRYPAYKPSGVEWLGEVPEHWDVCPLKSFLSIQNGLDHKEVMSDEGWPVFGSGGPFAQADTYLHDGETILLGRKGTIDKPLYYSGKFWAVDTMYWSKVKPGCIGRYVYYSCLGIPFAYYQTSTALPSMTKACLGGHTISRPSIQEQLAIATFLDHETAKIDALIAEQQRLIELLQEKRQAVISHAVTKGLNPDVPMKDSGVEWLGEVPEHWRVLRGSHVGSIFGSEQISEEKVSQQGDIPFIKVSTLSENGFECLEPVWFVDRADIRAGRGRKCFLAFPKRGAAIFGNKVNIIQAESLIDPNLMGWLISDNGDLAFYAYTLKSRKLEEIADVSTVPQINNKHIAQEFWPCPPLDEQLEIVAFLYDQVAMFDSLVDETSSSMALLQERRSALISAAVTGQIDVRGLVPEAEAA
jgi:type I restriction enzyme S subunit